MNHDKNRQETSTVTPEQAAFNESWACYYGHPATAIIGRFEPIAFDFAPKRWTGPVFPPHH